LSAAILLGSGNALGETPSLEAGFAAPPASARPRVWWHWMNGNISKDGIAKDLDWMKRVGIGGLQNFDANVSTPQVVDKRIVYMTPEWKDAFHFAAERADQLGLELAIASSPGWSETGGPWVKPADGMKKLVWSETEVTGGHPLESRLATPPETTGPFQALAYKSDSVFAGAGAVPPSAHGDIAVLAYPIESRTLLQPEIRIATGGSVDAVALAEGKPEAVLTVPLGPNLIASFSAPQTVRSATIYIQNGKGPLGGSTVEARLEVSQDGTNWATVAQLPPDGVPTTVSFAPATARLFRVVTEANAHPPAATGDPAAGAVGAGMMAFPAPKTVRIAQFSLHEDARVDRFETKAGFSTALDYYALKSSAASTDRGVMPSQVIDLTARMRPDGTLDWTPPQGRWRIIRFGWSLLGTTNHPATKEATGLEVDKYDGAAVRQYLETYLGMYRDAAGADLIGTHGVRAFLTDSTEVGAANWTPQMIEQFRRLRGYDPTPWLPTLAGALIGTRAQSDAFLYDYRRTLADLMASEHYGTVADVAHAHGLTVYGEALEDGRPLLGDDMAMRSHTDVPMAAMWTYPRATGPKPTYLADDKGASSVGHLYGRPIIAAESMTSIFAPWAYGSADLRRFVDLEFALGINRPVIHTSVHQPIDKAPGLSLFIVGQFFNRLDSWAELARPWVDYMARNSFMLQQGVNVADIAYFYGEEAPLTGLYDETPVADAPVRYAFDFANADVIANLLSVDHGDLVARSGARYRLLYLGGSSDRMTLTTLRRIADLVAQGATVVGNAPSGSPSLKDDPAAYAALVARLWSGQPMTRVGEGQVIAGHDVEAALAQIGVAPDFTFQGAHDANLLFVHRKLDDGEAYFVDNRRDRPERVEARFRVTGKMPELWHADTGKTEPVTYRIEGAQTIVPLDLGPEESVFVMFRKIATSPARTVSKPPAVTLATLDGAWQVAFQADRGAPASITLPKLGSLSEQTDPGVKYFSGVATYSRRFTLPRTMKAGESVTLNLGQVGTIADVRINGQPVGGAWHAPYLVDIGAALKKGGNTIEIRVADLWVNRLIGDAQPGAKKIGFTTIPTYTASAPLRPSGLIGPVTIEAAPQ
jgi:hypothetical protein